MCTTGRSDERDINHADLIVAAVNALPALLRIARAVKERHEAGNCGCAPAPYDTTFGTFTDYTDSCCAALAEMVGTQP